METQPRRRSVTATIPAGTAVSDTVNLGEYGGALAGLFMPAAWDAASLTMQVSDDGSTWANLYVRNTDGTTSEYAVTGVAAGRFIGLNPLDFAGARYLRVRSGTGASPVNQTADRALILRVLDL